MSPRCLVTNVRIVPRCHSFSCSSSVTRPCHYIPFQRRGKKEGRGRGREIVETGLSSDISSGSPGYCVLRETTPVIAITQAGRAAHTHTNTHAYIQYTGPKQPQAHTHTQTHTHICLHSHVNTEKYCPADVFRKIVQFSHVSSGERQVGFLFFFLTPSRTYGTCRSKQRHRRAYRPAALIIHAPVFQN